MKGYVVRKSNRWYAVIYEGLDPVTGRERRSWHPAGTGEAAAARLIVVDAVDEDAARFYSRHGFVPAPQQPLRLYRRMKDVRASLDAADS